MITPSTIPIRPRFLVNLKESLLVLCICYFYAIAFSLGLHREVFGLDDVRIFVSMCALFLFALSIEVLLSWWNKRAQFFWICMAVLFYGVMGLYVAPIIYGPSIITYVLLEPLVIVFVGGFAFVYGKVLSQALR